MSSVLNDMYISNDGLGAWGSQFGSYDSLYTMPIMKLPDCGYAEEMQRKWFGNEDYVRRTFGVNI